MDAPTQARFERLERIIAHLQQGLDILMKEKAKRDLGDDYPLED